MHGFWIVSHFKIEGHNADDCCILSTDQPFSLLPSKVSLYLFKELPLYLWKPSSSEIALIREWLLNYSLTTVENKLACIILEGLNWGFGEHVCIKTRRPEPDQFYRELITQPGTITELCFKQLITCFYMMAVHLIA